MSVTPAPNSTPKRHLDIKRSLTSVSGLCIAALFAVCSTATGANEISDAIDAVSETPISDYTRQLTLSPSSRSSLYIWQGFEHEWQRFVVLRNSGRVPHRISKFHNFIQQPDDDTSQASFHFAQSTGVDGNYMNPIGSYTAIQSDAISTLSGDIALQWTDEIESSSSPVANNKIRETLSIPLTEFPATNDQFAMILQGVQLDLACDDNQQPESNPCNSSGMWPYVFNIAVEQCAIEEQRFNCKLNIDIYRAWTPNRGGFQLPPIFEEIKPLNHSLDFSLRIYFSVIGGEQTLFSHHDNKNTTISSDIHLRTNKQSTLTSSSSNNELTTSTHAITSFGFSITAPDQLEQHWTLLGSDVTQQGRYIGKLTNRVTDIPQQGGNAKANINQSLWSPVTVVNGTSHVSMTTKTLFFPENIQYLSTKTVKGKLCINSTDQAPAFSRWTKCNNTGWLSRRIYGGREQLSHSVSLPTLNQF